MAKYFQFGINSWYNIGNTGWSVALYNAKYYQSGSWTLVPQAQIAQGSNAYLDYAWRWGGLDYTGVSACYNHNAGCQTATDYVKFYSSSTTISDGTLLWG